MEKAARRRLSTDARRGELLALGRRLFATRPYEELSIDEIAEAAGTSKGLLYHYFPGKHAFFVETVREAVRDLHASAAPDPERPPAEQLEQALDAYLDFVEESGGIYRTVMRGGLGRDPALEGIVESFRDVVAGWVLRALGIAVVPPVLRVALRGWIGFADAAVLDWHERGDAPREAVRALLESTLNQAVATAGRLA